MHRQIERVLISQQQIARRVAELAQQITAEHLRDFEGRELTIIPILTGAMIFCGDLIRQIPIAMRIGLLTVSSYPGQSVSSQGPQVLARQLGDLSGRHVLLLDDVLDSGQTISMVLGLLRESGAASLRSC